MKQIYAKVNLSNNFGMSFHSIMGILTLEELNNAGFEVQQVFNIRNSSTQLEETIAICIKRIEQEEEDAK